MPSSALQAVGARPRLIQQRPTQPATYELTNHAKAYLEAGQIHSGFDFLCSLLNVGASISTPAQPYLGYLAPPAYIGFAASVAVDPRFTTQVRSQIDARGTGAALRYLQCIHHTIDGLAYRTIRTAFSFPVERTRRRAPGQRSAADSRSPEFSGDVERIIGDDANERSLWHQAEDFWHVVGWAFNCSVAHKKRWHHWQLWLCVMLDFLETDWDFCVKLSSREEGNAGTPLQESLIWRYTIGNSSSVSRGARRRIVKALLSSGSYDSFKDYPEVWARETAEVRKRQKSDEEQAGVGYEDGEAGDHDEEELVDIDENDQPSRKMRPECIETVHQVADVLGGQEAIVLRQRLISLLAQVAEALPLQFTTLSDFFDNVLEDFNQLPTAVFQVLLCTLKMSTSLRIAFGQNLLLPLVSGKLPNYLQVEPLQEHFESKLLPVKATTQSYATNAKVAIIVEQMFSCMLEKDGALTPTVGLRKALEKGIAARQSVRGTTKGKKGNATEEEVGKELLDASSERLLGLFEILELSGGENTEPQRRDTWTAKNLASVSFASSSSLSAPPDRDTESDEGS